MYNVPCTILFKRTGRLIDSFCLDTLNLRLHQAINSLFSFKQRAVICQKQISVEGDGHCCHRPSSNWETNQPNNERSYIQPVLFSYKVGVLGPEFCLWTK